MFKLNIHLFRGVSIVLIVFSHCYNLTISSFGQNNDLLSKTFRDSVSGGSAFFVFISGVLFFTIYESNKKYLIFIFKKIKFVYLPFLFFISLDLYYIFFKLFINYFSPTIKQQYYQNALLNFDFSSAFFIGKSFISFGIYWYIPFIMVIYLISPFFLFYRRFDINFQIYLFLISLLVSSILQRNYSYEFVMIFQNVIYFFPFYLLGILSSINDEKKYFKITNKILIMLVLLAIIISIINNLFDTIIFRFIDVMIFQKILLCIIFSELLKNINSQNWEIIKLFANNSFGIFFVHPILLCLLGRVTILYGILYKTESFLIYFLIALSILFTSLIIVIVIKKILGSKSKYFIGV